MKKIIILSLTLCGFYTVYAQDCFDKLAKQAIAIDSLQKVVKTEKVYLQQIILDYQQISKNSNDSIKTLKSDLLKLEKFKVDKKSIDSQLKQKNDSIALFKNKISEIEQQISATKLMCEQNVREGKETGKNEALEDIVNSYKGKMFDDLLVLSTKISVQRDMRFVGNNAEVKPILSDLEKYFNAEELLSKKIDATQINNAQIQLNQINRQSSLLDKLKENLGYYKDFNGELKITIEKLVNLDKLKDGDINAETQKLKFNEIVSELANYMYNYYDYGNYPYLSDIVLDIIKRKKIHTNANLTDLLEKL